MSGWEPGGLGASGGRHALGNRGGGFACRALEFVQAGRRHLDVEIDAVEQRSRELAAVAVDVPGGTDALRAGISKMAATAGVAGGDQGEAGRKGEPGLSPDDGDDAVLERLAQRFQRVAPELGQFVEEQHAAVSEADLSGARHGAAPISPDDETPACGLRKGRVHSSALPRAEPDSE